jgi:hypothetical protein
MWDGSPALGTLFVNGFIVIKDNRGLSYQQQWSVPSDVFTGDNYFSRFARTFGWLRDLKATGDVSARRTARRMIEYWCENKRHHTKTKNKNDEMLATATRISNFILLYDFFGASASDTFKKKFFKSVTEEYRRLKSKYMLKCGNVSKLSIIKTFVEYNVYCDYDQDFFCILLNEISRVIKLINADIADISGKDVTVNDAYRILCLIVELRNALIQWEKSFLKYRSQKSYKLVFSQIQQTLQVIALIIRFYRHSNGMLCQLNEKTSSNYFFEPIKSLNIDIALSQVNYDSTLNEKRRNFILRCANKQAVLFINIQNKTPVQYQDNYINIMHNVMNFEWSFQSYGIVNDSFIAILHEHKMHKIKKSHYFDKTAIEHTLETISDGYIFCGISANNEEMFFFKRKLFFLKDSVKGTDSVIISDALNDTFLVLNFDISSEFVLHEIKHEEQSFVGEVVFFVQKTAHISKKNKVVCVLKVETEQLFCIKAKNKENKSVISIITNILPGITNNIHWSFHVTKQKSE